jgi:hypothetical protein
MSGKVLDVLIATAKSMGVELGKFDYMNGDAVVFENGMVISGLEMHIASESLVEIEKLVRLKLKGIT